MLGGEVKNSGKMLAIKFCRNYSQPNSGWSILVFQRNASNNFWQYSGRILAGVVRNTSGMSAIIPGVPAGSAPNLFGTPGLFLLGLADALI